MARDFLSDESLKIGGILYVFSKLHSWKKRFATQPQTIYSEFPKAILWKKAGTMGEFSFCLFAIPTKKPTPYCTFHSNLL